MLKIITSKEKLPAENCAFHLEKIFKQKHPTLLLWSGGSVSEVAKLLMEKLDQFSNLSWLTMSLVDERYGQPNHKDCNEALIRSTGIIDRLIEKGGKWEPILTGLSLEKETERVNTVMVNHFSNSTVIGVFGIGEDGHTAGILPIFDNEEAFDQLFQPVNNQLYSSYTFQQFNVQYSNPFSQRITLNLNGIKKLTERIILAQGEKKKEIIRKLKQNSESNGLFKFPAQIFHQVPSDLFTDV